MADLPANHPEIPKGEYEKNYTLYGNPETKDKPRLVPEERRAGAVAAKERKERDDAVKAEARAAARAEKAEAKAEAKKDGE